MDKTGDTSVDRRQTFCRKTDWEMNETAEKEKGRCWQFRVGAVGVMERVPNGREHQGEFGWMRPVRATSADDAATNALL